MEALRGRLSVAVLALALALAGGSTRPAQAQDVPIVYVRCARATAPVEVTMEVVVDGVRAPATRTMTGADVYDVLPDVTHFFGGFSAPCDLVHRDALGNERVLYDCSTSSTDASACAAMDPAVSFDASTVAFTVFRGPIRRVEEEVHAQMVDPRATNDESVAVDLPNRYLSAGDAVLHVVDVATGQVRALPHVPGTFDAGPAFLPDGRLAFTSTRDGNQATLVHRSSSDGQRGSRIYAMDLDGRNLDLSSHHALAQEQHPFVLRDGRVAYTSWQIFGGLPFRHTNGSPGSFTTIANLFHLYTQHPDGAEQFAFYGQHAGGHTPITAIDANHRAAHFLTQASDGRVWFADYYRGNNSGLGLVIGVMPEPEGQEGIHPDEAASWGDVYAPRDVIQLTTWSTASDRMAVPMPLPEYVHPRYADALPFAGKVGHPAALPDGGLMIVWGKGACGTVSSGAIYEALGRTAPPQVNGSGGAKAMNVISSLEMDTPGCDAGIYRVTRIPSTHPSDLEPIVDERDWHEIQARALVPYAAIHGIERPVRIERADLRASHRELELGTPFGLLGAASILDRETHPRGGITFQGERQFNTQGTDTIDYTDDDLCGVRILGVLPNRGRQVDEQIANVAGERVRILGEIAVRNRDASGAPRIDPSGHPDTSFLVRFPANVPYLMQGIDCDGRTLNTDQTWQSLRPGETKTCGGCHVHSREPRTTFDRTFAASPEYRVPHLGEGVVPLLAGRDERGEIATREAPGFGLAIDFTEDVIPIFERRCASCHGGDAPAAGLRLDGAASWHCLVGDRGQTCVPEALRHPTGERGNTLRRPQLTRYVRAFNSLASLLYWKASGRRTDGRTDDTFSDAESFERRDIDFGAAHPTDATPEELGVLSRWIDLGCPGGPRESDDTQRPTLTIAATVEADRVTALHVGTADLGSGVATGSLEVCVLDEGDSCAIDLRREAALAGTVVIPLDRPLDDPEVEVEARVTDVAGNLTVVRRTVRWLLGSAAPPAALDGGVASFTDGGASPAMSIDRAISGGCGCRAGGGRGGSPWPAIALLALAAVARSLQARRARRRARVGTRRRA
jgi:hypothetical protein